MPTYEYRCLECSYQAEHFQKITDAPLKRCPSCGNDALRRGPGGGIGISFKGSGFYITDYGAKKKCCRQKSPKSCCCKKKDA